MGKWAKEDQNQDMYGGLENKKSKLNKANAMWTLKKHGQIIWRLQICRQTILR